MTAPRTLHILPQPDASTCGPTCLHAVYNYFGDSIALDRVVAEAGSLPSGGTMAVLLACHALRRGYSATIYTYNLQLFDPTWFDGDRDLAALLAQQAAVKADSRLELATAAYLQFLALGGKVVYHELDAALLEHLLADRTPVLTGLSATYLYGCAREHADEYDSVRGEPAGHFVVLSEFDAVARAVAVSDPLETNPRFASHHYWVGVEPLVGAILLGVVTYDANLLVLQPS